MRNGVIAAVLALLGCREQPRIDPVRELAEVAPVSTDAGVIAMDAASRARFASLPVNVAEHGIDGTFELWRDHTLDDKTTGAQWMKATWERLEEDMKPPPRPVTAELILRDATGKLVESIDLEEPLALLKTIRLGDDPHPYFQVDVDTYKGVGRWGGAITKFVRIEKGRAVWLPCSVVECALGCAYVTDVRPSGGVDLLVARHLMEGDRTEYERIEIAGGKCHSSKRSVKGWVGEPVTIPPVASFPPRSVR